LNIDFLHTMQFLLKKNLRSHYVYYINRTFFINKKQQPYVKKPKNEEIFCEMINENLKPFIDENLDYHKSQGDKVS
jgi:hypothetical protein